MHLQIYTLALTKYPPVLSLPILKPTSSKLLANPMAGASPILPAGVTDKPMFIQPRRKVPVVNTTVLLYTISPDSTKNNANSDTFSS